MNNISKEVLKIIIFGQFFATSSRRNFILILKVVSQIEIEISNPW